MDIAALSTGMSQVKLAQQASISVMKMAMDTAQGGASDLTNMIQENTKIMEQSIAPYLGSNIDISM